MKTSEIIKCILDFYRLNPANFAKKIGTTPTQVYDWQKGRVKKISPNFIDKIVGAFPELNKIWLITGEGHMLNINLKPSNDMQENQQHEETQPKQENKSYTISEEVLKTISNQSETIRIQAETINKLLDKKNGKRLPRINRNGDIIGMQWEGGVI